MTWALFIITIIYVWWVFRLRQAWTSIEPDAYREDAQSEFVTVIVVVRNEAENITSLLHDLARQDYPQSNYEVIVIDDASEDKTFALVEAFGKQCSMQLRLFKNPPFGASSPKKSAVSFAIAQSKGELIVCTDGDCRVQSSWLSAMASSFHHKKIKMACGPVRFFNVGGWFPQFQQIEFASLIGTGAASIALKQPNMCNGANLAYRKSAFYEVGGFGGNEKLASGDDEFLMHKIASKFQDSIRFVKTPVAVVDTSHQKSLKSFFNQRKRWAGKWSFYSNPKAIRLAISIFIFHGFWVAGFVLFALGRMETDLFLASFVMRVFANGLFLQDILRFLDRPFSWFRMAILELIYSFYVVFFGIASNFGKYEWKGRKIS